MLLDTAKLRLDFPILAVRSPSGKPLVYLDNAATTQRPRQVIQAMVDVYEGTYANVHRGIHWLSERTTDDYENAREKVRRFINARSREEVIFTHGTTEGINLVARTWGDANVHCGDEILLTIAEHHSNLVPWQQLAERTGAAVRFAPVDDDGELQLDALDELLGPRTKLVAVAAVSNVLGTSMPLAVIIDRAHSVGARVLIDAAQSAPRLPTDVQSLGADFLAFSGHKLMGPSGVGVLWGRRELLAAMPPFLGGGGMIRRVRTDGFDAADLPAKFEAGTPPIVEAVGLGAALDYIQSIGMEAIAAHERALAERAHAVLKTIGGMRILGSAAGRKSGIVSFTMDKVHAHDLAQLLDREGIAIRAGHHCAMPLHRRLGVNASSRASFYLYNTFAEIDALGAVLEMARSVFRRK